MLYMVVFATSVFILLAFIYWRTAGFMMEQTDQTIEAEIVGLAEQYRSRGINGLMNVVRNRVSRKPDGQSLYLFTTADRLKLAGNLSEWPEEAGDGSDWINFTLDDKLGWEGEPRRARARLFEVQGGLQLLVGRDISELSRLKGLIETAMNWGMGISLGLALMGGYLMSRSTTRRIELINQTAYRIMHGDLTQRVPTRGTQDDFDQLADNLNQMLDRIEYLMEGIRHVSDSIAHDLKTPLTRLRTQLENTLLTVSENQTQEQVERAVAEADQLLGTFNALLRIARLETGGKTVDARSVDLTILTNDAVELYEALAEEKGQILEFSDSEPVTIKGDRDLLFQVISNLMDNAIKYTDEGGRIRVAVRQDNGHGVVEVADSGDGVPDHEKDKIFDRFYRVGKSRSQPGNGLGLSLVSAVVDMHDGAIELRDADPGALRPGLCVVIRFPVEPRSAEPARKEEASQSGSPRER